MFTTTANINNMLNKTTLCCIPRLSAIFSGKKSTDMQDLIKKLMYT